MMPGHNPSLVSTSLWQTPQACTLTRTSPGPGVGMSRSTISHAPWAFATCTTFIFFAAAICPPQNEFRIVYIACAAPVGLDAPPRYQGARNPARRKRPDWAQVRLQPGSNIGGYVAVRKCLCV